MGKWIWQKKVGYYCRKCDHVFRAHGSIWDGYLVKCPLCRKQRACPISWNPDGMTAGG